MSEELVKEYDHVLDFITGHEAMFLHALNSSRRLRSYVQAFYGVLQSLGSIWYSKHSIPLIRIFSKVHIPFDLPNLTKSHIDHVIGSLYNRQEYADSRSSASISADCSRPLANPRVLLPGSAPPHERPGYVSYHARNPTSPFHTIFSMSIFLRVAFARPIEKATDTTPTSCMPSTLSTVIAAVSAILLIAVSIYLGVWNIPQRVYLPLTGFTSVMAMMVVNKSDQMPIYGPYIVSYLWVILATILVRVERNRFPENQRDLFIVVLFLTFLSSWWIVTSAHPNDFMAAIPACFIFSIFIVTRLRRLLFALLTAVIGILPHTNEERQIGPLLQG